MRIVENSAWFKLMEPAKTEPFTRYLKISTTSIKVSIAKICVRMVWFVRRLKLVRSAMSITTRTATQNKFVSMYPNNSISTTVPRVFAS